MSQQFNEFISKLSATPTPEEIKAALSQYGETSPIRFIKSVFSQPMSKEDNLEILPLAFKVLSAYYPNPATLAVKLSFIRKVIKANQPPEVYQASRLSKYFNLPEEQRSKLKIDYQRKVAAKNNDLQQLDITSIMEAMENLAAKKNSTYAQGALLMLASGMRGMDLFKNIVQADGDKTIIIRNLAKKRSGDTTSVKRPIIGMTAEDFVKRLARFRSKFANRSVFDEEDQLVSNISSKLGDAARAVFPELADSQQAASMLRKYYCVLAYNLFADPTTQNYNTFIKKVLGHENLETTFSYSTIHLNGTKADTKEARGMLLGAGASLPPSPFAKIRRTASKAQKFELLHHIRKEHPQVSNAQLMKLSGIGTEILREFIEQNP